MRRHDKQHFANTGELKVTLQLTMRERLRKMATEWSSYNAKLIWRVVKKEPRGLQRASAAQCLVRCAAI
jgi:hypothetical protein